MSFDEEPDGDPHGECAAEIHRLQAEVKEQSATIAELTAERDRMKVALLQYGAHRPSCARAAVPPGSSSCTCGLHELMKNTSSQTIAPVPPIEPGDPLSIMPLEQGSNAGSAPAPSPVHYDPTGKTREMPHCPTCTCGIPAAEIKEGK